MKKIITLFAFCLTAATIFAQPPALKVDDTGNVGIGTADPARPLEVVGQIMASNLDSYPASKQSNFLMRHFDDTNVHFAFFNAQSDANNNQVLFGGGAGAQYAATVVAFMTGANRTTPLGTEGMRLNNQQRVRISSSGGTVSHPLTVYGGAAKDDGPNWAVASDKRLKENIRPFEGGLAEVLQIKPVTFNYIKQWDPESKPQVGVIAQDMQKIAPYTVQELKLEYESDEKANRKVQGIDTYLTYNHSSVSFMVINAIKEQQSMIDDLREENEELRKMINEVMETLAANETQIDASLEGDLKVASLDQNTPNPFNGQTQFRYFVPEGSTNARITITTNTGQVMKTINIADTGAGVLNLSASDIPTGTYFYSLTIDGKQIDTKKMSLVR